LPNSSGKPTLKVLFIKKKEYFPTCQVYKITINSHIYMF
jgi:hypothetical protein